MKHGNNREHYGTLREIHRIRLALGDRTAEFAAAAEAAGIVVRPFAGEGVRVSIGEPEANDRLIDVAGAFGVEG